MAAIDPGELQKSATTFANQMKDNVISVSGQLGGIFGSVTYPSLEYTPPWIEPQEVTPNVPGAPYIHVYEPAPLSPTMASITAPVFDSAPVFQMAAPVITLPSAPSSALPASPGNSPGFSSPALPDAPTITLPDVPTFGNILIPDAPSVSLPTFKSSLVIEDIIAPSNVFSFVEQQYEDPLLDALKLKLLDDMENGTYGIEPAVEQALWERAREREALAGEAAIQDAMRQQAARGFMLPPGAAFAQIEGAQQAALEKISSVSREIALKRADMYVEGRKFTIEQVRQVEQMLITYFGYMMERALNSAKAIVELGIASYNAQLERLRFNVEREKARAQVYETILRAAMANLEAWKVQIEGARLTADVQRLHADVYRTQLQGVEALIGIYRSEVDASRVKAEIENLKLQAFKTSVEAYAAQVGAKTSEFGMYEAQIRGEMSKVNIYQAQVGAYNAQVQGFATKVQAARVQLDAQLEPSKLLLEKYRADVSRYSASLQGAQTNVQAALGIYEGQLKAASILTEAAIKNAEIKVSTNRANADVMANAVKLATEVAIATSQQTATVASHLASAKTGIANAYGQMGAAAMASAMGLSAGVVTSSSSG